MSSTARAVFGLLIAALTAVACGTGSPTALPTPSPDPSQPLNTKDFIEALFLGTGPLADYSNRGCATQDDRMVGWPEGSLVTIAMPATLSSEERAGVMGPASQASEATNGAVTTSVEVANEPNPPPASIVVVTVPSLDEVHTICRSPTAALCAPISQSGGVIQSARIIGVENGGGTEPGFSQGPGFSHELGHALFGICHLNPASLVFQNRQGQSPSSIMGMGSLGMRLTDDDMRAIKAVYAAGLRAGAPRSQFIQAGLMNR